MARKPVFKKQTKAQKKSKSEEFLINTKYLGLEPVFADNVEITKSKQIMNFNWYAKMSSQSEAKEYMLDFLKSSGRDAEYKFVKANVPDKWVSLTYGGMARMITRGAKFSQDVLDRLDQAISDMISRDYSKVRMVAVQEDGGSTIQEEKPSQKPSVQDRMKAKISEFISGVEDIHDKIWMSWNINGFSMYEHLKANDIPPASAKQVYDFYNPKLLEVEAAYNKTDPEIVEGYAGYTRQQLEVLYDFYVIVVEDTERYMMNEKKVRKARTPKPISAEKKLKNFKFMPSHNQLKLQSVPPETILGASELWTFNTKYNQLTVFRLLNTSGLDVNRTSITNFHPASTLTKKLRAKDVPQVIDNVLKGGKVALRKLMEETRGSDQKLQERMNENTILLRVVKQ